MARDTLSSTARIYRRPGLTSSYTTQSPALIGDGYPLDAGTAMILANDLNHLQSECAPRQLVNDVGPGALVIVNSGWSGLNETVPDAADRTATAQAIAWGATTARCYGPFPAVIDRLDTDGRLCPRTVRFAVHAKGDGANDLTVYVSMTSTRRPPSDGNLGIFSATLMDNSGVTRLFDDVTSDLVVRGLPTVRRPETFTIGGGEAGGPLMGVSGYLRQPEFYLWCGYLAGGASPAYITSIAAWELPPT